MTSKCTITTAIALLGSFGTVLAAFDGPSATVGSNSCGNLDAGTTMSTLEGWATVDAVETSSRYTIKLEPAPDVKFPSQCADTWELSARFQAEGQGAYFVWCDVNNNAGCCRNSISVGKLVKSEGNVNTWALTPCVS